MGNRNLKKVSNFWPGWTDFEEKFQNIFEKVRDRVIEVINARSLAAALPRRLGPPGGVRAPKLRKIDFLEE